MHLSKVKHSKFNESGQLAFFYAVSAFWGIDLIVRVSARCSLSMEHFRGPPFKNDNNDINIPNLYSALL